MTAWLRKGLVAVLLLGGALLAAGAAAVWHGDGKRERRIVLPPRERPPLLLREDAATLARGRYLYASRGCVDCHGASGSGRTVVNDGAMHVVGPNLTAGAQGVVAGYTLEDWERTLRHGVKPDGRPVLFMPSEDYAGYTDDDLVALVAYVRSLPAQPGEAARVAFPLPVRALYGIGLVEDAAEKIDHRRAPPAPVPAAVTPAHGRYVAQMCQGCHGAGLSGGKIPGGPPAWPAAANLTPGPDSVMPRYPDAERFAAMMRGGRRPDGSTIAVMPFESLRALNDTDLHALYAYLQTVPPRPAGEH
jgi:mono/diheme cytochrome c family protein